METEFLALCFSSDHPLSPLALLLLFLRGYAREFKHPEFISLLSDKLVLSIMLKAFVYCSGSDLR
jgi:hypothetical protein